MPKARFGNFTLRKIAVNVPAHLAMHRFAALQRSGQYSELRPIQRGKSAFDIVGYHWPDKGTRRKLNIGRARINPTYSIGDMILFRYGKSRRYGKVSGIGRLKGNRAYYYVDMPLPSGGFKYVLVYADQVDRDVPLWEYQQHKKNPNQKGATTPNQVKFGMRGRTKIGWINKETPTKYLITYKDGAQTRHVWRLKNKVKFVLTGKTGRVPNNCPKTANNPAADAIRASERFHQLKPRFRKDQHFEWPKSLSCIGPVARIEYISDKFDGKVKQYFHDFGKGTQVYFDPRSQRNGDSLLIIRGPFTIEPEGITG